MYENQLREIKKQSKFTIPVAIYNDVEYNSNRRLIILLIASLLEEHKDFKQKDREEQDQIIIDIELSCYTSTIKKSNELLIYINWENTKFTYLYQLFCNKITKNIDTNSEVNDNYLINKIINNEIDIKNIAELTSDELCPVKANNIKQNLILRNQQKLNYKTSTLYSCKNCKKRNVTVKEIQMRSLDEGSNLSLTCLFCGYHWVA